MGLKINTYEDFSNYIAENLDKNIKYSEYIAENLDKNIKYSEYIAEKMNYYVFLDYYDVVTEKKKYNDMTDMYKKSNHLRDKIKNHAKYIVSKIEFDDKLIEKYSKYLYNKLNIDHRIMNQKLFLDNLKKYIKYYQTKEISQPIGKLFYMDYYYKS